MKRLLIASPARGGLPAYYMKMIAELLHIGIEGWDIDFSVEGSNHSLPMARNILAGEAIAKGYDRIIFHDTDHPTEMRHWQRLLSHDHEKVPVVSPLYTLKRPGAPFFLGIRKKGAEVRDDGLLPAQFLPTGMLSISVDALRRVAAAHPEREFYVQNNVLMPIGDARATEHTAFEFFPVGVNGPRTAEARLRRLRKLLATLPEDKGLMPVSAMRAILEDEQPPGFLTGEDYNASWLFATSGVDMFLDTQLLILHEGKITYPMIDSNLIAKEPTRIPEMVGTVENW